MDTEPGAPIVVTYEPVAELAELCREAIVGASGVRVVREPARVRLSMLVAAARFVLAHLGHVRKIRLVQEHLTHTSRRLDVVALCFACDTVTSLRLKE